MLTPLNEKLEQRFIPKAVLIVFRSSKNNYDNDYYLETRPVKEDGTLGVAKPASTELLRGIAESYMLSNSLRPHGAIPANLLFADSTTGREKYIWWTPPGKRFLQFSKGTGMKDGIYNMPGCVYMMKDQNLYVWAFKGKKPDRRKNLLFGPFYNYYESGRICLGNARTKWPEDLTWTALEQYWEKLFWESDNSHMIINPMAKGANLNTAIKEAENKPFDTDSLNETKITIEDLIIGKATF